MGIGSREGIIVCNYLWGKRIEQGRETRPLRKEQPYPIHLPAVVMVTARAIHESPLRKEQPYPIHLPAVVIPRIRPHRRGRVSRPYFIS